MTKLGSLSLPICLRFLLSCLNLTLGCSDCCPLCCSDWSWTPMLPSSQCRSISSHCKWYRSGKYFWQQQAALRKTFTKRWQKKAARKVYSWTCLAAVLKPVYNRAFLIKFTVKSLSRSHIRNIDCWLLFYFIIVLAAWWNFGTSRL